MVVMRQTRFGCLIVITQLYVSSVCSQPEEVKLCDQVQILWKENQEKCQNSFSVFAVSHFCLTSQLNESNNLLKSSEISIFPSFRQIAQNLNCVYFGESSEAISLCKVVRKLS